ncbi:MAG TPA: SDR family oxidoreductase [Gammaproteobacteria bacterium]|nr:SDR family oxidoreductase [Gammaproteobacteria bacterium]
MNLDLTGRHALVCGASQGIGRAAAQALAALGATVTLLARDVHALEAVRDALPASGGRRHHFLSVDFDSPEELRALLANALPDLPPVAILVNNTGGPPAGPAHLAHTDEYLAAFRRHLVCNQILVQAVLPGMRTAGYGRIINIISTSVKEPIKGLGVSNTVRGAVASWAKTLAGELGPEGITVNNVLPGYTRTQRLAMLFAARAEKTGRPLAEIEAEALAQIPLGRFAEAEEIANAVAFLASPAASYINGVNLPVDGGRIQSL